MISLVVMPRQETAAVDGVTTHTLAASHVRAAACAAARAAGAMAERTERRKYFHVGPLPVGHAFSCSLPPLRHLLWGRLGKAAERFIASLGDVACASGQGCLLKDMLVQHALCFLSLSLQWGSPEMYHTTGPTKMHAQAIFPQHAWRMYGCMHTSLALQHMCCTEKKTRQAAPRGGSHHLDQKERADHKQIHPLRTGHPSHSQRYLQNKRRTNTSTTRSDPVA